MTQSTDYLIHCTQCGAKNRVPSAKVNLRPKCGKCGAWLDVSGIFMDTPVVVTDLNFENMVLGSQLTVLLDCWAPWCGPCRTVGPIMDELAREWSGRIRVAKLNVDENPKTSARFQIRSIPTMLIFRSGQLVDTIVGALPKAEIARRLSPYLTV